MRLCCPARLQVSGDAFLQCLKLALDAAPNMHQALQVRQAPAAGGVAVWLQQSAMHWRASLPAPAAC